MKRIFYILLILAGLIPLPKLHAQSVLDTVCAGATGKVYWVTGSPGSVFNWTVSGTASATTVNDSLLVNWGLVPGLYPISVVETSAIGCPGNVVNGSVLVLAVPSVNLGNDTTVCTNTGYLLDAGPGAASYLWQNGSTSETYLVVNSGTYWVLVSNAAGCTAMDTIHVNILTPPSVNLGPDTVSCNNSPILLNAGSGFASYHWSNGSTLQTLQVTSSGSYSVTVTASNGCSASDMINVSVSSPVTISGTVSNVPCSGGTNGSINLTVTGGITPYTYIWQNGSTTQNITGLAAGQYNVTVSGATACSSTAAYTVTQPSAINVTSVITNPGCSYQSTGAVDITVTGGSTPYTYHWSNNATTQDIINVLGGSYTVTITDSHNCGYTGNYTVQAPAVLTPAITTVSVTCHGLSNGSATVNLTGGTSPYTYLWSNGTTTQTVSGLPAGNYSIIVHDANGCSANSSFSISQPAQLQTALAGINITCTGLSDGAINMTIIGGTSPFSFLWSNGATTQNINTLPGGYYTVTITDAHLCQNTNSVYMIYPPLLVANLTPNQIPCYGGTNGSINMAVSGGTTPYHYLWSTAATTLNISSLIPGTYIVTVTDGNNCVTTSSATVVQPVGPLTVTPVVTNVPCFGGSNGAINLTVTGGTSPYTYHWSNNATTTNLTGLSGGAFAVTVTDSHLCTASTSATVTVPPTPINLYNSITNLLCNGNSSGAISLLVTGGVTPYSYQWSNSATTQNIAQIPAGTYTVTITDSNQCVASSSYTVTQPSAVTLYYTQVNVGCYGGLTGSINLTVVGGSTPYTYIWSNAVTTQDLNNIASGLYVVSVTDANSCPPSIDSIQITQASSALNINLVPSNVNCFGDSTGSINVTVTGGIQPYTYIWTNGATTEDINGLSVGTYTISVTDYNNCHINGVTNISQPDSALTSSSQTGQVSCHGAADGFIDLTVSGGTSPYSFAWTGGDTTQNIVDIIAGNFTVTITDHNNCTQVQSFSITQPLALIITSQITDILCNADSTGSIDLTVTGGISPFNYTWSDTDTTQDITGLTSGTYSVTVTDSNNCLGTAVYSVGQPASGLVLTAASTDDHCYMDSNGSVDLTVTGGTSPYTYTWSNGRTTQDIINLTSGQYQVTVSDNHGCFVTADATVDQPDLIVVNVTVLSNFNGYSVSCFGSADGLVSITVTGGVTPYSFIWSDGSNQQNLTNIQAGVYIVTITDYNGCKNYAEAYVIQPSQISLTDAVVNPTCPGMADGSINITVNGGIHPYSYIWTNNQVTPAITGLATGIYTVTVTDGNNCFAVDEVNLPNVYEDCLFIPSAFTPNGDGYNDVWNIRGIELYPNCIISVYNRWGQLLFRSDIGYHQKWDGKYNGKELPTDTYYYVVDLKDGYDPFVGHVTIIR